TLQHAAQSLKLFQWVYFAARPLSLSELRLAMNVDANPDYYTFEDWRRCESYIEDDLLMQRKLRSLSGGLAEVKGGGSASIVQFIHLSVNDYFLARGFQSLDVQLNSVPVVTGMSHTRLSWSCIAYLASCGINKDLLREPWVQQQDESEYPFLQYARYNYLRHARIAEENGMEQTDLFLYLGRPPVAARNSRPGPRPRPMVEYLKDGPTLLHVASRGNLPGLVAAILRHPELCSHEPNQRDAEGQTPLTIAVLEGHKTVVELLVMDENVDINTRDKNGHTPLLNSVYRCQCETAALLVARAELDVNVQDEDGWSALTYAAGFGQDNNVQRLLTREDTDVNVRDDDGRTPLALAVRHESIAVKLLLEREDVDVNTQDKDGWTPLIKAVDERYETNVRWLLLRHDLDLSIRDNDGNTALDHAEAYGNVCIIRQLRVAIQASEHPSPS
ncbi:MAG: hypothetical protein M1820_010465, partial [Bogoriella megaspora]